MRTALPLVVVVLSACAALVSLAACAAAARHGEAAPCSLNSECAAPLVCRLGACRNECNSARDCRPGLACVRDENMLGVCQLEMEKHCALDSACPSPLVCRSMECVNECVETRDCPPGAECRMGGCIDPGADHPCVRDSECTLDHLVCAFGRCRPECVTSRDCRYGTLCHPTTHACVRGDQIPDGEVPDLGSADGGVDAGPTCFDPATHANGTIGTGNGVTCMGLSGVAAYGSVQCWGQNTQGELGNPAAGSASSSPVVVPGLIHIIRLALGQGHHVCASDGATMWCWGANAYGQLGDGTMTDRPTPVAVSGLTGVSEITVGVSSTCAIADPGRTLYCWGDATNGALGDGRSTGNSVLPQPVGTFTGMVGVAVGLRSACAVDGSYGVYCWGENDGGVVGDGTQVAMLTPYHVMLVGSYDGVHLGSESACVASFGHDAYCWGLNTQGELALPPSSTPATPARITYPFLGAVSHVQVGDRFACANGSTSTALCWGLGAQGQLGDGTTVPYRATIAASDAVMIGAYVLSVGYSHACALPSAAGPVYCWGDNAWGQLGVDPTTTGFSNVPIMPRCVP